MVFFLIEFRPLVSVLNPVVLSFSVRESVKGLDPVKFRVSGDLLPFRLMGPSS